MHTSSKEVVYFFGDVGDGFSWKCDLCSIRRCTQEPLTWQNKTVYLSKVLCFFAKVLCWCWQTSTLSNGSTAGCRHVWPVQLHRTCTDRRLYLHAAGIALTCSFGNERAAAHGDRYYTPTPSQASWCERLMKRHIRLHWSLIFTAGGAAVICVTREWFTFNAQ